MDYEIVLEHYQTAVVILIAAVLIAVGYIMTLPMPAQPGEATCPIHKRPRSQCKPEWHE